MFNRKGSENLEKAIKTNQFDWIAACDRFYIGCSTVHTLSGCDIGRDIYITSKPQINGDILWVVEMDGMVLTKKGKYEYEVNPSSRTDKYIKKTRFDSKEDAYDALITYERKNNGNTNI